MEGFGGILRSCPRTSQKLPLINQGGPGSVRFGYGLGMERFEWFRFSVPAAPLRRGFYVFQYSLAERPVPVPVRFMRHPVSEVAFMSKSPDATLFGATS